MWRQAKQRHQDVPDVSAWDWVQNVNTKVCAPFWTMVDDASKACAFLHHCGCGKTADVPEQVSNALYFVTVKVDASTTMHCK